ncbi:MAG: hypothetical protein HYT46_01740, partial [Candidatus Vogelbacteria bacterium]|nr:hypothetical protein [Candidatus Vogelbacteria bacterium]
VILDLLERTEIPRGHDEIIATLDEQFGTDSGWGEELAEVKLGLLAQKQAAEAAATDLRQSFPYNGKERALMIVIEKIIRIVQNWRQPSPQARDKVTEIFKLFETAKKISRAADDRDFQIALADLK